jgi:hypothetical protein
MKLCHGPIFVIILLICPWPLYFVLCLFRLYLFRLLRVGRYVISTLFYYLYSLYFFFRKPREILPDPPYRSVPLFYGPQLFSVAFADSIIDSSSMNLSSIRIPIQWCEPSTQHSRKDRARTQSPHRCNRFFRWTALYSILALGFMPTAYSLPSTNHAVIFGETSNDLSRQCAYTQTALDQTIDAHTDSYALGVDRSADGETKMTDQSISQIPFCFVADTDSVPYILDTGANRVILNDAKLFHKFQARNGSVKGIGGDPVTLSGVGSIRLPLKSDNGSVDYVDVDDAVYVPTSPYNLVPPQVLIHKLKT